MVKSLKNMLMIFIFIMIYSTVAAEDVPTEEIEGSYCNQILQNDCLKAMVGLYEFAECTIDMQASFFIVEHPTNINDKMVWIEKWILTGCGIEITSEVKFTEDKVTGTSYDIKTLQERQTGPKALEGKWAWGKVENGCEDAYHIIAYNPADSMYTLKYKKSMKYNGKQMDTFHYKLISYEDNVYEMMCKEEYRKNESGELIRWYLKYFNTYYGWTPSDRPGIMHFPVNRCE